MFTGIIEEVGTVAALEQSDAGGRVRIKCSQVLPKLEVASSIAISGCCLTVVAKDETSFSADLAPETLNRTAFRRLAKGAKLNLEPCLTLEKPLDGHIVQGHVDGTGTLIGLNETGEGPSAGLPRQAGSGQANYWLDIEIPGALKRYIVEKGSIAVEGISLTVAAIEGDKGNELRIAIIPFTYRETNLHTLKPGDPVNLECDVIAKYVEKLMGERSAASGTLTLDRLRDEGF